MNDRFLSLLLFGTIMEEMLIMWKSLHLGCSHCSYSAKALHVRHLYCMKTCPSSLQLSILGCMNIHCWSFLLALSWKNVQARHPSLSSVLFCLLPSGLTHSPRPTRGLQTHWWCSRAYLSFSPHLSSCLSCFTKPREPRRQALTLREGRPVGRGELRTLTH